MICAHLLYDKIDACLDGLPGFLLGEGEGGISLFKSSLPPCFPYICNYMYDCCDSEIGSSALNIPLRGPKIQTFLQEEFRTPQVEWKPRLPVQGFAWVLFCLINEPVCVSSSAIS